MAARKQVEMAFVAAGNVIESLCKICCVADRQPFPYSKWLVEAAKRTQMGATICGQWHWGLSQPSGRLSLARLGAGKRIANDIADCSKQAEEIGVGLRLD